MPAAPVPAQPVAQLTQARRSGAARPRVARVKGGIVIRPAEHHVLGAARASRRTRSTPAGGTPYFDSSPATLTSSSTGTRCSAWRSICATTDSLSTEWISRTRGSTSFVLRLWRWPMKSQVKRSPQRSCLAISAWAVFSPTSVTPASASAPISSTGTYLVAARTSTSAASRPARGAGARRCDPAPPTRRAPHPAGVELLYLASQASPAWRPVRPPSRRWEKNSSGWQLVQRPGERHVLARRAPRARGARRAAGRASARRGRRRGRCARRPRSPPGRPRSSRARSPGRSRPRPRPCRASRRTARRPRAPRCRPPRRASRSGPSRPRRAPRARAARSRRPAPAASRPPSRSPARRLAPGRRRVIRTLAARPGGSW